MLTRIDFMPPQYLKKAVYTGNHSGMRYRMEKAEEQLKTTIWAGPYAYEKIADEQKEEFYSSFDETGIANAIAWLNQKYEEKQQLWDEVPILGLNS
ncbi:MAG: hypothetical protein E7269_04355 [Lachnospiraceae bacterium]|nr:hypothetical protein [Lachnospiraceae bacterium]